MGFLGEFAAAIGRKIDGPVVPHLGSFKNSEGATETIAFFKPLKRKDLLFAIPVDKGTQVNIGLGEAGVHETLPQRTVYVVREYEGIDSMGSGRLSDGRYIKILGQVPIIPLDGVKIVPVSFQN
jgi:hypothetical protein